MRIRAAFIAATIAVAVLPAVPTAGAAVPESPVVRPIISWEMEPRFGLDANGDGLVDLPNTLEYVHNRPAGSCLVGCPTPTFTVHFDGSATTATAGGAPLIVAGYRWDVEGGDLPHRITATRHDPTFSLDLAEGRYVVALTVVTVVPWGMTTTTSWKTIDVDDLLVVAIGDSYASGEGNPEIARTPGGEEARWADGGDGTVTRAHEAAHRSTVSWPAQAAMLLEVADPHTSVTFVSVASSGATVSRGLLSGQSDELPTAQIEQVRELVGERPIDTVAMSIGGNDIGFARIVAGLVAADPQLDPFCYDVKVANVWAAANDGDWGRGSRVSFEGLLDVRCRATRTSGAQLAGLAGLPSELDRLDAALDVLGPAEVVVVEYADPATNGADGDACDEIVGDATPPFTFHEIDGTELAEGTTRVLRPLNTVLQNASVRNGWTYVGGVMEAFGAGHGYCASWPDYGYPTDFYESSRWTRNRLLHPTGWYRNPGNLAAPALIGGSEVSWFRTAAQSSALQGPDDRIRTTGTMHPNELGHVAMARLVLPHLLPGR